MAKYNKGTRATRSASFCAHFALLLDSLKARKVEQQEKKVPVSLTPIVMLEEADCRWWCQHASITRRRGIEEATQRRRLSADCLVLRVSSLWCSSPQKTASLQLIGQTYENTIELLYCLVTQEGRGEEGVTIIAFDIWALCGKSLRWMCVTVCLMHTLNW